MNFVTRFLLLSLIISLPFIGMAQRRGHKPPKGKNYKFRVSNNYKFSEALSIFGSVGITNYYGDLCDDFKCIQLRPNFGIGMMYRFSNYISSKSEINYIRLHSKDVWVDRNLSFRSSNFEIYTSVMYDYYKFTKNLRKRKLFSPYVFAGFGVIFYNPKGELNGKWHTLRPLKTEGISYGIVAPIIPFGAGVKIKHTRNWDFIVEGGYRFTFTDYLDDVSSYKFKKMDEFNGDEVAASLSNKTLEGDAFVGQRGNPERNDGYLVISLKARYTFAMKYAFRNKYIDQHRKVF